MEYDFLQQFAKRMNSVGMYAMLMKNSWQKTTWKTFDIESVEEQLNICITLYDGAVVRRRNLYNR